MKLRNHLLVIALFMTATHLHGGIRYEFVESNRIEETAQSTRLVARAVIEGDMSRLDVISGNRYEPGNYIITHGDNRIYVVDPEARSYVEYLTNQRQINPERIRITNVTTRFDEIPESTASIVAGYPTRHFRLHLTYDIEVMMGTVPIRQKVETMIDRWTTTAFDHLIKQYRDSADELKTGNPEIDAIIEAEATRFSGLTLKERVQIVTSSGSKPKNATVKLPSTRKRTREMAVSKIEEVTVTPNYFAIPVDYTLGQPAKAPGTAAQYLTMQPDDQ